MAMNPILPWHIASSSFCVVMIILILFQVCRNPNKLRLSILGYSLMAIPPSIVNTLHVQGMISARANSMVYLVSTLLMTFAHFLMMLEVGYRLRIGEGNWKDPLVTIGMVFLGISCILLFVQIGILAVNSSGSEEHPLKGCFIAGVVTSIVGHTSVFTYTFTPLLYWKKNRTNEGLSRITALGVCCLNNTGTHLDSILIILYIHLDLVFRNSKYLVYVLRRSLRVVFRDELLGLFPDVIGHRLRHAFY